MSSPVELRRYLPSAASGQFAALLDEAPWAITSGAETIIKRAAKSLAGFVIEDGVAVHRRATVERGATIKPPAIIRQGAFVAAGAYLRGGVFLDDDCIVGPNCEVRSTFMLAGSRIAHLSFVGDSILGAGVNVEAGAVIANTRNERDDKRISIRLGDGLIATGVEKFGALVGESAQIGAGAVIAPGALIEPGATVARLSLLDQSA